MLGRTLPAIPLALLLACSQAASRDPERASETPDSAEEARGPEPAAGAPEPTRREAPAAERGDAAPSPEAPAAEGGGAAGEMHRILEAHNRYRRRHCAPPLSWSETLEEIAGEWANTLQERDCRLQHSPHRHGENLAIGSAGTLDAERVVELWYKERELYDFEDPGFTMETGHFTQLVWASSRNLGCAKTRCPGVDLWICNYTPGGNTLNHFEANVRRASCERDSGR